MVVGVLFASLQLAGERVPVVLTGDDERDGGRETPVWQGELMGNKSGTCCSHF